MDEQDFNAKTAGLIARVKGILINPKAEWPVINGEGGSIAGIFTGYVIPLALIGPVAHLIGSLAFGYSFFGITYRPSIMEALPAAVVQFILSVASVFVMMLAVDFLAPQFNGTANRLNALKLVAYGATASWIAGIFGIIPGLAMLSILGLYSLYLFYLGAPVMMKVPEDKAVMFIVVLIVALFVVSIVIGAVTAMFVPTGLGAMHGGSLSLPH